MLENAHTGGVSSLVLSYNRRFILTGGPQGEVRLWELRTRELISHLKEHKQKITNIRLYHDDTLAVSGSRDRCMLRWDLRNEVKLCFG
jgi:WD40 repeat protein